ncbi:hypothetical protein VQZ12_004707 [Salmonella enterica]|nr:hypothetical protein [Salmonella enterica subsp. salamae]EKC2495460.1 hypothetical protein [Salmonella enterica]EMD3918240.1 hypothetical protein [Salmonella enterica]
MDTYEKLKQEVDDDELFLFIDGSHPTQRKNWRMAGCPPDIEAHMMETAGNRTRLNIM